MSVNVPLHKWRSADPVILIGRRCIARTDQDVIIDGRLELIRHPDGTASLRFQGIGNDIIDHDPNTCSNSMGDGIRSLAICTALAGCGGMAKASTPAHAAKPIDSQCTDGGTTNGFYECVITLQDTRKVDCVVYAWEKQGGLSCDWSHVSGADKDPER